MPEASWDSTVAQAAPSTPMWRYFINRISRTMFTATAAIRKCSGVRLSPRERSTAELRLYSIVAPTPMNTMKI